MDHRFRFRAPKLAIDCESLINGLAEKSPVPFRLIVQNENGNDVFEGRKILLRVLSILPDAEVYSGGIILQVARVKQTSKSVQYGPHTIWFSAPTSGYGPLRHYPQAIEGHPEDSFFLPGAVLPEIPPF